MLPGLHTYIHTCLRHRTDQAASVPTLKSSFFKRRQKKNIRDSCSLSKVCLSTDHACYFLSPLRGVGLTFLGDGVQVDHGNATYYFQSLSAAFHLQSAFSDFVERAVAKVLSLIIINNNNHVSKQINISPLLTLTALFQWSLLLTSM